MEVGFQGALGAYSQLAANWFFKDQDIRLHPVNEFRSLFDLVEKGKISYGVVPIENSLAGSIHENYDHLRARKVWICGEYKLRVSHNLLAHRTVKLSEIRKVYSHPQALAQCAGFLRKMKNVEIIPYFDTAGSARFVAEHNKSPQACAAIASKIAAKHYKLKILAKAIEDDEQNYTRFLLISKVNAGLLKAKRNKEKMKMKTSIVFALKNIPGCLHKCLSIFAIRDIDLFKIESRPIPGSPWQYLFYLDFEGDINDEAQARALSHLREITAFIKVLGSYPPCPIKRS